MINTQLRLDSMRTKVDLGTTFMNHRNILEIHYENPNAKAVGDLEGLLKQNELEVI